VGVVFVIVWDLCLLLWGLCLLLFGGSVCYCVGVVFIIVWGFVLVIVWGLCLLLWGLCLLLCGGCVCYCSGVVFVIVIFVWLFKFNNVIWDKIGDVIGWSFIRCCLCQFEIGALDKGFLDLSVSHFVCPSFWCVSIVFEVH